MNVLLLHGQGRTTNAMRLLGFRLSRLGHEVGYFRYYTRSEKFNDIVKRLVARIRSLPFNLPYALIGHSMGGLLARASLPILQDHLPFHLIMLASPSQPPRLAPFVRQNRLYRFLTTDCGQKVLNPDFYQTLPMPAIPTTIIAGAGGPRVAWLPYKDEPNDGVMSVQDTYLGAGYEVIEVPSIHTFIMNSRHTLQHIERILRRVGT
ncbi:MAG: alpha/beta fold hydrolase [Chloroflexi bacterium]|nr:alpha/beta fold hydrolase [Chloroflexota bacterium]